MSRFARKSVVQRQSRGGGWRWWVPFALIMVCGGGYVAAWQVGASYLRDEVDRTIADMQGQGFIVEANTLAVEGFPGEIGVMADQLSIRHLDGSQVLVPQLDAMARSWDLTTYRVRMPEGGSIAFGPLLSTVVGVDGATDWATATLRQPQRDAGLPGRFDATFRGLEITPHGDAPLRTDTLSILFHDDPSEPRPQGLTVHIEGLSIPTETPFGRLVETGAVRLEPLPTLDLPMTAPVLAAWRDAGGAILVSDGLLRMGGLEAHADGSFTLDDDLQPAGEFWVTITDLDAVLRRLVDAGILNGMTANLIGVAGRAFSGLEAPSDPQSGSGQQSGGGSAAVEQGAVTLPLSIEDRSIRLGPIAIWRFDPIHWPE